MFRKTDLLLLLIVLMVSMVVLPGVFASPTEPGQELILPPGLIDRENEDSIRASLPLEEEIIAEPLKKMSTDLRGLVDDKFLLSWETRDVLKEKMKDLKQFVPAVDPVPFLDQEAPGDLVYVYIYMNEDIATSVVDNYAWEVLNYSEKAGLVVAWVEVDRLKDLARLDDVRSIRTVQPPVTRTGSIVSEGDKIHRADLVRSFYGVDGSTIKVGVISDGVDNWQEARDSGDLPDDLTILRNDIGGDEGTAMLEIIHDLAPGADLYFHDLGGNILAFNDAISSLVAAGCNVIVDDVGWITEPFFEDGIVAEHVSSVLENNDIIYVSSAGNAAQSHYQGQFYPLLDPNPGWHDFSHGEEAAVTDLYAQLKPGGNIRVVLQWNDPFGGSANSYQLWLVDFPASNDLLAFSDNQQDGTGDPLEFISYTNNSGSAKDVQIWVSKDHGQPRELEVYIYVTGGGVYLNNLVPEDSIFGHPAVPEALAVGALHPDEPGEIAFYSSRGPSTIAFPQYEQRNKPDICGIAGVSVTGAGGFPSPFYGTSAAAPHVAAIAALSWSADPEKSGTQIRQVLLDNSQDLGSPGFNHTYGYGRADAISAVDSLKDPIIGSTIYWQHQDGRLASWSMAGYYLRSTNIIDNADPGWQVKEVVDINNNGHADLVWQHDDGQLSVWFMEGHDLQAVKPILNPGSGDNYVDPAWEMMAVYDLNSSGHPDIIWQDVNGTLAIWFMDGLEAYATGRLTHGEGLATVDPSWQLRAVTDLLGDGEPELLWQNVSGKHEGELAYWVLDGFKRADGGRLTHLDGRAVIDPAWTMITAYDLLGDDSPEILWQRDDGAIAYWTMNGSGRNGGGRFIPRFLDDPGWRMLGCGN